MELPKQITLLTKKHTEKSHVEIFQGVIHGGIFWLPLSILSKSLYIPGTITFEFLINVVLMV